MKSPTAILLQLQSLFNDLDRASAQLSADYNEVREEKRIVRSMMTKIAEEIRQSNNWDNN